MILIVLITISIIIIVIIILDHHGFTSKENYDSNDKNNGNDGGQNRKGGNNDASSASKSYFRRFAILNILIQRVLANISITINDLKLRHVDHYSNSELCLNISKLSTYATSLNSQPLPEVLDFVTAWKLCHRNISIENISVYLDVIKPHIPESMFCFLQNIHNMTAYDVFFFS